MPVERHTHLHLQQRNRGLRRLQILTRAVTVAMAALTAVFAGLAAASNGGRKHVRTQTVVAAPSSQPARPGHVPPPPSLPPLSSSEQLQSSSPPAPPAEAPTPAQSPPVAVSGGS